MNNRYIIIKYYNIMYIILLFITISRSNYIYKQIQIQLNSNLMVLKIIDILKYRNLIVRVYVMN